MVFGNDAAERGGDFAAVELFLRVFVVGDGDFVFGVFFVQFFFGDRDVAFLGKGFGAVEFALGVIANQLFAHDFDLLELVIKSENDVAFVDARAFREGAGADDANDAGAEGGVVDGFGDAADPSDVFGCGGVEGRGDYGDEAGE